jgi:hypothetical protein
LPAKLELLRRNDVTYEPRQGRRQAPVAPAISIFRDDIYVIFGAAASR